MRGPVPVNEQRGGQAEYRAQFDAVVTFAMAAACGAEGFRVDVAGPDVTAAEVAALPGPGTALIRRATGQGMGQAVPR